MDLVSKGKYSVIGRCSGHLVMSQVLLLGMRMTALNTYVNCTVIMRFILNWVYTLLLLKTTTTIAITITTITTTTTIITTTARFILNWHYTLLLKTSTITTTAATRVATAITSITVIKNLSYLQKFEKGYHFQYK